MITLYTKPYCQFCFAAKRLLALRSIEYAEVAIDQKPEAAAEMIERTGNRTVPQVIINDTPIGGFNELSELDRTGKLDAMLSGV